MSDTALVAGGESPPLLPTGELRAEADSHTDNQAERNGGPQWCEKCSVALMARVRQAPLVTAEGGR